GQVPRGRAVDLHLGRGDPGGGRARREVRHVGPVRVRPVAARGAARARRGSLSAVGARSARRAAVVSLLVLLGLTFVAGIAVSPASAQPGATTTTLPVEHRNLGDIIPAPNSGREPTSPGDRGGWMQISLFF